ncbi:DNA polymerase III subunit gamma/tau [Paracoccaceae bacterium GXU_MW_L88]
MHLHVNRARERSVMSDSDYQVLARKYRPQDFSDLVGQDAMVRTLKNAFETGRIAHAFILTGVRGVGKTTTARIIAKGLNCVGPDGNGGPTISPCGECEPCKAIAEGRHVDVMEMDAASRTGVGDIREIIDSVAYRAASARYKIYIIDEVHMLSTSAFNALLKTVEEPPEHVKFIFATTEIGKVPVTILSRCQRFDLRRIEPEQMIAYLGKVAAAEGAAISEDALALLTRAAEGSMRDALSLMDQAIALGGEGELGPDALRDMLGLADRGRVIDLFEMVMKGDAAGALGELGAQYEAGADPLATLRDLSELTHWISVAKITPEAAEDITLPPDQRARGKDLAARLPMSVLARSWSMLLKALDEVSTAPNAMMAAEMAIIRLTHVADLPPPGDLVKKLQDTPPQPSVGGPASGGGGGGPVARQAGGPTIAYQSPDPAPEPVAAPAAKDALARYAQFEDVVALAKLRDMSFGLDLEKQMRVARYAPGLIEFTPTPDAPDDLAMRLGNRLKEWTHQRWAVVVSNDADTPTLAEQKETAKADRHSVAAQNPLVQAVLETFPGAQVVNVQEYTTEEEPLPEEFDPDWDPFDDAGDGFDD